MKHSVNAGRKISRQKSLHIAAELSLRTTYLLASDGFTHYAPSSFRRRPESSDGNAPMIALSQRRNVSAAIVHTDRFDQTIPPLDSGLRRNDEQEHQSGLTGS